MMAGTTSPFSASTCMVPARRFTSAFSTPGTAFVTFSTRAEQAAQVMPVTLNLSFMILPPFQWNSSNEPVFRINSLTIHFIYDTILP